MNNVFFFQTQQIFFSYFQVDNKYYLFFYGQKYIDIDFLYQSFEDMSSNVIQELDSKTQWLKACL